MLKRELGFWLVVAGRTCHRSSWIHAWAMGASLAIGATMPVEASAIPQVDENPVTEGHRVTAAAEQRGRGQKSSGNNDADFMFGVPRGSYAIRLGYDWARAQGEIFDFTTDQLTLEASDFNSPTIGFDLGLRIRSRLDAVFRLEYGKSSSSSEFRDFVDQDDLPIVQQTSLTRVPLTVSLKLYLTSRGRAVGRFAWVPSNFAIYAGCGVGYAYYSFEQEGDFVDFIDLDIFTTKFVSSGWAPIAHLFGGADVKLSPKMGLTLEGRYAWAKAEMSNDFVGFNSIDLTGFRANVGVYWRF